MTSSKTNAKCAEKLTEFLSESFVLYMKTYAVHWNFQGIKFFSVHKLTESQYQDIAGAIDEIAERIRALDFHTPVSLEQILGPSNLKEFKNTASNDSSLNDLAKSHKKLSQLGLQMAKDLNECGDLVSSDMIVNRCKFHDKAHWMLNGLLS